MYKIHGKSLSRKSETWWYGKWDKKTIDWWWGEGDEKFFIDGEKFPSTFGTGCEDYIGYAWSAEPPFALFESPFANQPFQLLMAMGILLSTGFKYLIMCLFKHLSKAAWKNTN
ncbi:MAG: DUF2961 domain-containing protein [Segetibacter sp.]